MYANCYHLLMEVHPIRERPRPSRAGFVLTGGNSSRMGRDKATLPWGESTLVEHIAGCVRTATLNTSRGNSTSCGTVTLIGAPERYADLGLRAVADRYENCGPLGGICTALEITSADWNLIVACDMPGVTTDFLAGLLAAAETAEADCLIPEIDGLHPLCAVYHRRAAPIAKRQILDKSLKMHDFVAHLRTVAFPSAAAFMENMNTPQDWTSR